MPSRPVSHEGNRVLDHFHSFEEFEMTLMEAAGRASTVFENNFLKDLNRRYKEFSKGLYLSANQAKTLRRIADKVD